MEGSQMQNNLFMTIQGFRESHDTLFLSTLGILWVSAFILLISVVYKFVEHRENSVNRHVVIRKKHLIETFSMTAVIVVIFNILQFEIGILVTDFETRVLAAAFGGVLTLLGTFIHLWSKMAIGQYWSNQIEAIKEQKIVTTGPYAIVRHPMYSSIIVWLVGLSIMFLNYASLLCTTFIFIPMMILRANAEDKVLKEIDKTGFGIYRRSTAQLIPRFGGAISFLLRCVVIVMLGYSLFTKEMEIARFALLFVAHLLTGIILNVPKISFSFVNKSFVMLGIFTCMQFYPPAFWLFYIVLFFDIWGLFGDCPCMLIYNKYNGCPCFDFVKGCIYKTECNSLVDKGSHQK